MSAALSLYRGATHMLAPIAGPWLKARIKRGKEDEKRWRERFGASELERPDGRLIWLHGASVGEMGVILLLRDALAARDPALNFLISTGTKTSAELFARRAPAQARHVYSPIDLPRAAERFLDHWKPDLGVFAESELWPNLLMSAHARGVPLALVNARMSAGTLEHWGRMPSAARTLLDCFALRIAGDARTAEGLAALAESAPRALPNLKLAAPAPRVHPEELALLRRDAGERPIWLAGSTHPGEDEIVLAAHALLRERFPNALLVIAPRHPERGPAVAAHADDAPRRARGARIGDGPVYIADTMGELGLFYAFAPVSLVAGSLLPGLKGHNPVEPAKLGSAILHGPHVESFSDLYALLDQAGGAVETSDPAAIAAHVGAYWRDAALKQSRADAARACVANGENALQETTDALMALLAGALMESAARA